MQENFGVVIVDDELLARERLVRLIDPIEGFSVIGIFDNGIEALESLYELKPHILLLDISMHGLTGLDIAGRLKEMQNPPAVIFCTAYPQHALEAFDLQASGYLLKPIRQENLKESLIGATALNRAQQEAYQEGSDQKKKTHLTLESSKGLEILDLSMVSHFAVEQNYVFAYRTGDAILVDKTMRELEYECGDQFFRVHRNALVSVEHILGLEREGNEWRAVLKKSDKKPVISRRHLQSLKDYLSK